MDFTVKTGLGFFIGILNLIGLISTLTALYAVSIILKMPRPSSIYIMAAANLTIDAVQLLFALIYLAPSIVLDSYLIPGGREGHAVIALGTVFMCCWYYGSFAQMVVSVNRLIVVCFPRYDFFTSRRVVLMMLTLCFIAFGLAFMAQYVLPCCNLSYDHIVLSYTYLEIPNVFNYSNAYIDLWLNSISSIISFICYTTIIVYVRRMNKVTCEGLDADQRQKRRMKEYRYALQFSIISISYVFAWVFFRVYPMFFTPGDSLNWFCVVPICVTINCTANALVYLFSNIEVRKVIKSRLFGGSSANISSDHHSTSRNNRKGIGAETTTNQR